MKNSLPLKQFPNLRILAWCVFLTILLFIFDAITPDSVASGVLYVMVVFLSLGSTNRQHTYFFAAVGSVLIFLGLSSPYEIFHSYPNLVLGLCAIWGTVVVGLKYKQGKEARLYLAELVDSSSDVILSRTFDGVITSWNKAAEETFGYTAEEAIGQNAEIIIPEDHRREIDDLVERIKRGQKVPDIQTVRRKKNGELVHVWVTISPIKDMLGNVVGISSITRDITDRLKSEQELKDLQSRLQLEKFKLEQVLNIEEELHRLVNLDKVVDFIVQNTVKVLGADRCSLMLLDDETQELCIRAQHGLDVRMVEKTRLHIGESIAGFVAQHGNPLLVGDIEQDMMFGRANRSSCRNKSFMCVPVKLDDRVIGIINVADKKGKQPLFDDLDLKVLCMIARQAATAIENAKLYRELKYLTVTDPLTNMFNFRQFAKSLDREISRMQRYPGALSILMIDVDNFKSYNDAYGHLAGDVLLKSIGRVLAQTTRAVDIACRYAGDEFVVILPQTKADQACLVAEKIKKKIAELNLQREVTVSIGIAAYAPSMSRYDLILKADMALYHVKREGKNRIGIS